MSMSDLAEFHFLRPVWLWLLAGAALVPLVWWLSARRDRLGHHAIDSHLLQYLLVKPKAHRWFSPASFSTAAIILGALGAAGPTWEREPSPFTEDLAPLVVALDASWSMNAIDISPTRLERAKQKIRELLTARAGARTALVAYAGSGHLVMPFTDDAAAVELFLPGIDPTVMPVQGQNPAAALALADTLLAAETTPGSILFFTDSVPQDQIPAFVRHEKAAPGQVLILAVGTAEGGPVRVSDDNFQTDATGARVIARLDKAGLEALASDAGTFVASVTVDDRDIRRVAANVQRHLQAAQAANETRWRDAGYAFVVPVAVIGALWFRKGWTMRWAVLIGALAGWQSPLLAQETAPAAFHFVDLWLTADQQGRYYFERGDYHEAAARFADPRWKGIACYRAGSFPCAVDQFARLDDADANYDLGNALARQGKYKLAVQAYDRALAISPALADAQFNRALVVKAMRRPKPKEEEQEEAPDMKPDKVQFDDKGKKGKTGLVSRSLAEVQTDAWLKSVKSDPGQFLRAKFAAEAASANPTKAR